MAIRREREARRYFVPDNSCIAKLTPSFLLVSAIIHRHFWAEQLADEDDTAATYFTLWPLHPFPYPYMLSELYFIDAYVGSFNHSVRTHLPDVSSKLIWGISAELISSHWLPSDTTGNICNNRSQWLPILAHYPTWLADASCITDHAPMQRSVAPSAQQLHGREARQLEAGRGQDIGNIRTLRFSISSWYLLQIDKAAHVGGLSVIMNPGGWWPVQTESGGWYDLTGSRNQFLL